MTIYFLEGPQGNGKTLAAVAFCHGEWLQGRRIVSNVEMKFNEDAEHSNVPFDFTFFTLEYFGKHIVGHDLENIAFLLDEAKQYFSSRRTGSKQSEAWSSFYHQCRKRHVNMYVTDQRLMNLDIRFRHAVDVRIACKFKKERPCRTCHGTGYFRGVQCYHCNGYGETGEVTGFMRDIHGVMELPKKDGSVREGKRGSVYTLKVPASEYWGFYDTDQRIPLQKKMVEFDTAEVL